MSKRTQAVKFLMVTRESDYPKNNAKPLRMLLPVKSIKQIQVTERRASFNVEAYTISDYYYYVVTAHTTAGDADSALCQLMDYLNGI